MYRFFVFSCDSEAPQNNVLPRTMRGQKSRQEMKGISCILKKTVNETWNLFRKLCHSTWSDICTAHVTTDSVANRRHRRAISSNVCFENCLFLWAYSCTKQRFYTEEGGTGWYRKIMSCAYVSFWSKEGGVDFTMLSWYLLVQDEGKCKIR